MEVMAAIISGGAIVTAAIIKFAPSNNNRVCKEHAGVVVWMKNIDTRLTEIHDDVKALRK